MRELGPTTLIEDTEIEELAAKHYGIQGFNPSHHGLIGGDDADGYVLIEATDVELERYDYWQEEVLGWIAGTDDASHNLDGLIHRFVLDGHLERGVYVVHGCWG